MRSIAVIAVLAIVLLSCSQHSSRSKTSVTEYKERYTIAMTTHDDAVIESTLRYMDELLAKDDSGIGSIPLNKAQLLFRLKRYDEAVQTLTQAAAGDRFHLGTLLLRLGRVPEGRKVLTDLLTAQDQQLSDAGLTASERADLIGTKVTVMLYVGRDPSQVIDQAVRLGQLSQGQAANLKEGLSADTDDLLRTLWPN